MPQFWLQWGKNMLGKPRDTHEVLLLKIGFTETAHKKMKAKEDKQNLEV